MPVAVLVCPHCEKPVELQVTAVTRSRPCPECSKHIMLQFTQKQGRVKRKALLVTTSGGLDFDALKSDIPVEEPQPLPGDAFERMKADPELIAIKQRFAWSVGVVAALVVIATIFHLNRDRWFPEAARVSQPVVEQSEPEVVVKRVESMIAEAPRPDKKPEKLNFTAKEKEMAVQAGDSGRKIQGLTVNKGPQIGAKNPIPGVSIQGPNSVGSVATMPASKLPDVLGSLPRSLFRIKRSSTDAKN